MIALTRKTDYALVAMVHLAKQLDELSSARQIACKYGVPVSTLMNIMKSLTRAGLIESVRGVHGGYRLSRQPGELTLKAVIEAIEGPVQLLACTGTEEGSHPGCDLMGSCPAYHTAAKVHRRFDEFLDGVTVAELAGEACGSAQRRSERIVEISV